MRTGLVSTVAVLCVATIGSAPVYAQDAEATEQADDPIVCRQGPPQTGTRMGRTRICLRHSEWERRERELDRNNRQMFIENGMGQPGGGPGG